MNNHEEIPKGKYSLAEITSPTAQMELKQLQKALQQWRNEKKNHNFKQLKNIALTLEKLTRILERQQDSIQEIKRRLNE